MDILRFITAGNVDDGKSTLIGRLLYDTLNIKKDVLASVTDDTQQTGATNLAFITDGLREERQQGITIDVAYKYFTTTGRKYIITDAPGHAEYTRNLVTGASGADAMIILIDAQNGITDQTRRHSMVAAFLKIRQVVVAVNKMDLLEYSEEVFNALKEEYRAIANKLQLPEVTFIPISALHGDNVSVASVHMNWYRGKTLVQYLEGCMPVEYNADVARFAVQYVLDNGERGYAGKILSGNFNVGDEVVVYPNGAVTEIRKIISGYEEVRMANTGQNIVAFLENDVAAKRGDIVAAMSNGPMCSNELEADICWLNADAVLLPGSTYYLRINGTETKCIVTEVLYKTDISTFERSDANTAVMVNEFARVKIKTDAVVAYDPYSIVPEDGRGILIDPASNYTCAALII